MAWTHFENRQHLPKLSFFKRERLGNPVRQGRCNLLAALASIIVLGFALGLSYPLLSLLLEARGVSSSAIGVNAALQPLGTILALFAVPGLVHRYGAQPVAIICILVTALAITLYPLTGAYLVWCWLRLVQGFAFSALYAISEAWVVRFAEGPRRGRILSIYVSAFAASMACAPMLIAIVGLHDNMPFWVGAAATLAAIVPVLMIVDEPQSKTTSPKPAIAAPLCAAPFIFVAVAIYATVEAACLSLLPVYGVKAGLPAEAAALLLVAFVAGPIFLQYGIGALADRCNRHAVVAGCVNVAALMFAGLPYLLASYLVWPLLLIAGAAATGLYTVALVMLAERFTGDVLVTGTATISASYGLGSLAGALALGSAMDLLGASTLPIMLAVLCATFLVPVYSSSRVRSLPIRIREGRNGTAAPARTGDP